MPQVFVLTTFWNGVELLRRCLESLESQRQPACVVLVDDGSRAPAHDFAAEWCAAAGDRVLLTQPKNEGPAAARNRGLEWIRAHAKDDRDVVVLVDGDDELPHDEVLTKIVAVYQQSPEVQLTLGGCRRASGLPIYSARYEPWHFRLGQVRAVSWRARHPRTFRVGLLRRVWPRLRLRWPNGSWIRAGTDQALLLPMLEMIEWHQLRQLEEELYIYNDIRPDGATMEASLGGRLRQLAGEAYVRRSLPWSVAALPLLALTTAKRRLRKLEGRR